MGQTKLKSTAHKSCHDFFYLRALLEVATVGAGINALIITAPETKCGQAFQREKDAKACVDQTEQASLVRAVF